jgi:(p)ppGpp synthase/HD superfamily hydrolase
MHNTAEMAHMVAAICFKEARPDTYSHTLRVAENFHDDSTENVVAYLHDVLEDAGDLVSANFIYEWFGPLVGASVATLTRSDDESYWDYIDRLVQGNWAHREADPIVRAVKLADARDNLMRSRGQVSRQRRYERVIETLS